MIDIANESTKALERERQSLMRGRARLLATQRKVAAELDRRYRDAALRRDLEGLERKHKVNLVKPQGIESAEGVNGQ